MRRFASAAAVCFILVCALTGCGQHERFGHDPSIVVPKNPLIEPPTVPGKYGGMLAYAGQGDPKTFNTWTAEDAVSGTVTGNLYDSLITRDGYTQLPQARLAYLPKVSNHGLTFTFTLRPNLKWSDGVPLTADDVIFTLNVLYDHSVNTLYLSGLLVPVTQPNGTIKEEPFKYKKIDERTVQFTLPAPFAPYVDAFSFAIMPKHALEAAYRSGQFNSTWGIDTKPSKIVGCGPFDLQHYVPGQRVTYVPNPYYWRWSGKNHLPYLGRMIYNITPDQNQLALNFEAGDSDDITVPTKFYPALARYARRDNYTMLDDGPSFNTGFIALNENPTSTMARTPALLKLFSNEQFRQALSYAVDRQTICNIVALGLAKPLYGPLTEANKVYFDRNITTYPFNLAKARAMLTKIGLSPGADGYLRYDGRPVRFTIFTSAEGTSKDIATIVVNDWQKLGLNVQQSVITFDDMDTKISAPPYDWQAVLMGFGGGPDPNGMFDLWQSSSISHLWWPREPRPETAWEARIDTDFEKGAQTIDIADRKKYYDDWQETVALEQPLIYLDNAEVWEALRNHFGNIKPCASGALWNPDEIFDTHATGAMPAQ